MRDLATMVSVSEKSNCGSLGSHLFGNFCGSALGPCSDGLHQRPVIWFTIVGDEGTVAWLKYCLRMEATGSSSAPS